MIIDFVITLFPISILYVLYPQWFKYASQTLHTEHHAAAWRTDMSKNDGAIKQTFT